MPDPALTSFNEKVYAESNAYEKSPHLRHPSINRLLLGQLRNAVNDVRARGLEAALLDVGAGTGPFTPAALNAGCTVTATDVAPSAVAGFNARYEAQPRATAVLDLQGDLSILGDRRFSVILFASVLHHIADYEQAIEDSLQHLVPGGALLTFQDPLWYPRLPRAVRLLRSGSYVAWRVTQRRDTVSGIGNRLRRATGRLDEFRASDMVEYHVVRNGVDDHALERRFADRFERFAVIRYWSTPSVIGQRLGERLGAKTEFALGGIGYRG
ncbi:MAG: class I SAM-dependent methyltransferase [Solirubrobacteraceae bacterium]